MVNTHDENVILDDSRPRKRRRISDPHRPTLQQLALEEIDLEIAIRQRIAATLQARLTWASLLQDSLQTKTNGSGCFKEASLDALDAIEEPCSLIFNRESHLAPPPIPIPPPANLAPAVVPSTDSLLSLSSARPTRTRVHNRPPPAPPKRLLYLRDNTTNPPEIAKLACSVCSRSNFSNLQGLLNHCRLRHQLEYGSHDECVQSCAVLVPEAERDFVVANGVELAGISLPSLRRLFEIAVGAGENVKLPDPSKKPLAPSSVKLEAPHTLVSLSAGTVASESPPPRPTTPLAARSRSHVSRTLGYHVDTPALAPFLGRAPRQRQINIRANEDDQIEIEGSSGSSGLQARHMWRKPYTHRNVARQELDEVIPLSELPAGAGEGNDESEGHDDNHERPRLQQLSGTRFHISARIQVADYSLFIPSKRRPADQPTHSHRWRLAVTSPSYSLPISSVLSKLTVASATDNPPSNLVEPVTISASPFVITGTTDRPFLARLTLMWAGSMNSPTEIEHWVELDPMHYSSAVLGEEQVFDVELDRNTELLSARENVNEHSWDDEPLTGASLSHAQDELEPQEEEEPEPAYSAKLRSLLPQYPMTMKDVKGRSTARLPYTLPSTPVALGNMHYGRRKAIEMGRARAMREEYNNLLSQSSDAEPRPLTTVEVFRWLEDESCFVRPDGAYTAQSRMQLKSSRKRQRSGDPRGKDYCRACGLQRVQHPVAQEDDTKPSLATSAPAFGTALGLCTSFREDEDAGTQPPVLDVDALLRSATASDRRSPLPHGFSSALIAPRPPLPCPAFSEDLSTSCFHPEDIVAIADPRLTAAILRMTDLPRTRSVVRHTHQAPRAEPHIESSTTSGLGLLDLREPRAAVLAHLAPSALLARAVKAVVGQLIACGVDALRQDDGALRSAPNGRHRHRDERDGCETSAMPQRLLTPGHVVRGLVHHAHTDIAAAALLLCAARLGEDGSSEQRR